MTVRPATAVRVDQALQMLRQGRSAVAVVAHLTQTGGIQRRQAQRCVALAYAQLRDDIEQCGIDRRTESAHLVHVLHEAMAQALASGHASAVVGCCRELRELLALAA